MGTISDKLTYLNDTKTAIKEAIAAKGIDVADSDTDTFRSYADKISTIETGGSSSGGSADVAGITIDNIFAVNEYGILVKASGELNCTAERMGYYGMSHAFYRCTGLTSASFSALTTINGEMNHAFYGCTGLTSVSFPNLTKTSGNKYMSYMFANCINLTSISFPALITLGGTYTMNYAFSGCTSLTSVSFPNLTKMENGTMAYAFSGCTSLTSVSFPALTSSSFGSYEGHFINMLKGVTGCTVHFPSNLESTLSSWSSVTAGFGGTDTTVLYDLDATE